jgi:alpha-mannosidase
LSRVYDKSAGREILDGAGNRLWAYVDKPREWDAWDVDEDYELEGEEVLCVESVEIVEDGPLRAAVRVVRVWRDSRIVQTYTLLSGSRRIDIATEIYWDERRVLLRALFPVNVRSHEATYETMHGVVRRPTHRNSAWDAARFEVCAHRFVDLSEPGYGVALLNDGKYGHNVKDNVLGISLIRSPIYPDPRADEGNHRFTYSLFPHPEGWVEADVAGEAFALNSPLIPTLAGEEMTGFGLVEAEGVSLMLGSLKKAEDGRSIVLRLYEPHGTRGTCTLYFRCRIKNAERADLLEKPLNEELQVEGSVLRLPIRPFEVFTLRLQLESV